MTVWALLLLFFLPAVMAKNKNQLMVPLNGDANHLFGYSITMGHLSSQNPLMPVIVIGAPGPAGSLGTVYLNNCWAEKTCIQTELSVLRNELVSGDKFGFSVSVKGNLLAVGAPGTNSSRGAMYIYYCPSSARYFYCEMMSRVAPPELVGGDEFGYSVAGQKFEVVAVGAPSTQDGGRVYIYDCDPRGFCGPGGHKAMMTGEKPGDRFGASVSMNDKDTLAVGAPNHNQGTGAVYVYDCKAIPCTLGSKLEPPTRDPVQFGHAVSISRLGQDTTSIVVGAPGHVSSTGAAYLFICSRNCSMATRLTPSGPVAGDGFGFSVSLFGADAVVGSLTPSFGDPKGMVHAFRCQGEVGSMWTCREVQGLTEVGGCFGHAVAVFQGHVVVGAPCSSSNVGSSYLYPEVFSLSLALTPTPASALALLLPTLLFALL